MTALELYDVNCQRGSFSLQLERWVTRAGEFRAILGCNGAGKSTLLKVIAGDTPSKGQRLLHGRPIAQWADSVRARHLAVLPQTSELSFAFVAEEVVALGAIPLKMGWRELRQAAGSMMALADCADLAGKPYPQLSGGEKQRVHFARVLLQLSQAEQPPLLLLDEPTSAQDLKQQHRLMTVVRRLAQEQKFAVVAVLHDLNLALRYTNQCTLMANGTVAQEGPTASVLTLDNVAAHWGYAARYATADSGERILC